MGLFGFLIRISFDLWLKWNILSKDSFKWNLYHSRVIYSPKVLGEKSGALVSSSWHLGGHFSPMCNGNSQLDLTSMQSQKLQRDVRRTCNISLTKPCRLSALAWTQTEPEDIKPENLTHIITKMVMIFSVSHKFLFLWAPLKTVEEVKVCRRVSSYSSKHVSSTGLGGQRERERWWGGEKEERRGEAGSRRARKLQISSHLLATQWENLFQFSDIASWWSIRDACQSLKEKESNAVSQTQNKNYKTKSNALQVLLFQMLWPLFSMGKSLSPISTAPPNALWSESQIREELPNPR